MFKRILVPTDGSELSDAAARKAIEFAETIHGNVIGFHATSRPNYMPGEVDYSPVSEFGMDWFRPDRAAVERNANKYLSVINQLSEAANVPCECFFEFHESPYRAIIEAAETHKCDLIFMGSHGRGAMSGLFLGSVTQQVMSHSDIPVLVYRDSKITRRMESVIAESRHYRI